MDTEKKIKISVDSSDVESTSKRLQREAMEASKQLLEDALERTNSSKEMLKYLEDEVKAMERIQDMASKMRRMDLTEQINRNPEDKQALGELERSKIDEKEDKLRTELIRDGLDEVVKAVREQTDEQKKGEQRSKSEERSSNVSISKDEKLRRELAKRFESERSNERTRDGAFASGMRGYGSSIIGSRNAFELGTNMLQETGGMMAGAGNVGAGVALVLSAMAAKRVWGDTEKYYKGMGAMYGVTGQGAPWDGYGLSYSKYGMAATDFVQSVPALAKARRTSEGVQQAAVEQMLYTRGLGMDASQYVGAEQLGVLSKKKGGDIVQESIAAMRAAGIVNGGDMAAVGDNLSLMVNLGKEQVARLGKVDTGINTKMVAALANMDDTLKRSPEALNTMVNAVRSGLTSSTSPQSDALKMSVLSRIKPGASIFDLLKMKENPFSEESQQYLPEFLKQLKKVSGNDDRFYMNIAKEFGLSQSMAEKLGVGYKSGKLGAILKQDFTGQKGVDDIAGRAEKSVSRQETIALEGANAVVATVEGLKSSFDKVKDMISRITGDGYKPVAVKITNPQDTTKTTTPPNF